MVIWGSALASLKRRGAGVEAPDKRVSSAVEAAAAASFPGSAIKRGRAFRGLDRGGQAVSGDNYCRTRQV
jgi:hypothetical protein